ncbi:NAD(P)-binding protein [bacterium]|nr:NAD(P)-binding protein [bacterium]
MNIAIVGAGIAGSSAGRSLVDQGHTVTLLDKGRGAGGRCSSRLRDDLSFDYGAQYFTARDPRFNDVIRSLAQQGFVSNWECRSGVLGTSDFHDIRPSVARWVGFPTMNRLVKGLQQGLDVHYGQTITELQKSPQGWSLLASEQTFGPFDSVLLTAPAPQAQTLLQPHVPEMAEQLNAVAYEPCLVAMAQLHQPSGLAFDAATVKDIEDGLGFVGRDSSKPGRAHTPEHWVLHSSVPWAQQHLEDPVSQVASKLWQAFCKRTRISTDLLDQLSGHRWRYARVSAPLGRPYLWDARQRLGWAGDGAMGPRLESAFVSAISLIQVIDAAP